MRVSVISSVIDNFCPPCILHPPPCSQSSETDGGFSFFCLVFFSCVIKNNINTNQRQLTIVAPTTTTTSDNDTDIKQHPFKINHKSDNENVIADYHC